MLKQCFSYLEMLVVGVDPPQIGVGLLLLQLYLLID